MSNIKIIQVPPDETGYDRAILSLLDGYAQIPLIHGEPLPDQVLQRLLPGLREHGGLIFLALDTAGDDITVIGVATAFRGYSTFYARPLVNVHDLAVHDEWRGQGVGSRLLLAIEAHARETGCCKVTLEVLVENKRAHALYHRLGFDRGLDGMLLPPSYFLQKPLRPIDS